MSQFALPLAWPAKLGDRDFIIGVANEGAVRHLEHPALWPVMTTILVGPARSGRSLLGRLFASSRGASLIDDAQRVEEEHLFHAWNSAQVSRRPLLLIADARPPAWWINLPDLRSRLAASPSVAIEEPDDALIGALLAKQLGLRGLAATPELVRWLVPRIPRRYQAIEEVVETLDRSSLSQRRRLTVPLAREVLRSVIDLSQETE